MIRRLGWLAVFFILIQLIPYGHQHSNRPVVKEPAWDSPRTRALAKRACFDCHSNETVWPWYSNIAPVSWLTQNDVNGGRDHLNFSEWNRPQSRARHAVEEIENGNMPIWFYVSIHPPAKLTPEEKAALIEGLRRTPGLHEEDSED
jgi:hypothetical protein